MKVQFRFLYDAESMMDRLRDDGWELQRGLLDVISARHPQVTSEREARNRLYSLGLLTSGALRVEFPMRAPAAAM